MIRGFSLFMMVSFLMMSCQQKETHFNQKTKFSLVSKETSNINFSNIVTESTFNNLITNFYVYNGAGVAVGDINNDGLDDIYFVSNQGQDKLYLNQGNLHFKDITQQAKINNSDGWSTGVTMVDINSDGWLDIFVSKSSPVKNKALLQNKVYINLKDESFKEDSKALGLDHLGLSVQNYFVDFDQDGDVDIYTLDHQMRNIVFKENTTKKVKEQYMNLGNQLYRNDNGYFTNITSLAFSKLSIYPSLSASIGDFNNDNWPDIYVCNDFLMPDQLFINNKNGTFSDEILSRTNHISSNSMGSDFADLNNDQYPDLLVLDMLAEDHIRSKENMTSMNSALFDSIVELGYQKQYMSNVLQLNNKDGTFLEIGQLAGINKTDWSWGPLIADFDNDGLKDIFISNGIEKDIDNRDFRTSYQKYLDDEKRLSLDEFHNLIPSKKLSNYAFKNNGNLTFSNISEKWEINQNINSNGVAYSDLDNDGDLDLILNNINDNASIYENHSSKNYLKIKLEGSGKNPFAIGAKVYVYSSGVTQFQQVYNTRGFQSSSSLVLNFGLNKASEIDSVKVVWGVNKISNIYNLKTNQELVLKYRDAQEISSFPTRERASILTEVDEVNFEKSYFKSDFNDFDLQLLLPQKQSIKVKALEIGDLNGDGLDDFFIGNSKGLSSEIYMQLANGQFSRSNVNLLFKDKEFQTTNVVVFDADNDADNDIYVANGGYEFVNNNSAQEDVLYINDGKGNFTKSKNALPQLASNSSVVKIFDLDNDNDLDLLVLGGVKPGQYPLSDSSYILRNTNGVFTNVTQDVLPEIASIQGVLNDAEFSDYDNDGDQDLIVVGEWMPITFFRNDNNTFVRESLEDLKFTNGWWNTISKVDIDNDGDDDYVLGNLGGNNKFKPSKEKPLHIFAKDFDNNGSFDIALSKDYNGKLVPVRGRDCSSQQNAFISEKIPSFSLFANSNMDDIYGAENLASATHLKTFTLSTSCLINKGHGDFNLTELPKQSQFSPTLDFEILDINNDGNKDIIGLGNFYNTEVETISYDAGRGYVLVGDGHGGFSYLENSGLNLNSDTRSISQISIKGTEHLIVSSFDDQISIYRINDNNE